MSGSVTLFEMVRAEVMIRTTGATPDLVDLEVRWAAQELLHATRLWREEYTVTLVAGTVDYVLPLELWESVSVLVEAKYGDSTLDKGVVYLPDDQTGAPRAAGMLNDRTVSIYPAPTAAETLPLRLDVALNILPSHDITPPEALRPYHSALVEGTLARMFSMPNKPWSDLKQADFRVRSFESSKAEIRRDLDRGRTKGPLFARIAPFA